MHYYDIRKADRELQVFSGHKKAVSYVKFLNANTLVSASTDSQECFMITKNGKNFYEFTVKSTVNTNNNETFEAQNVEVWQ